MIGQDPAESRYVFLADTERTCEGGSLAAEQRVMRPLHAACELIATALHVLVDH